MSGVIKGVGKVFKRVASSASKILPVALAAGAVMFTAGNALGVTSSWGDAVKSVTDSLGMGSTLSNVISGAVTNAGYGAVAGAATGAISGGDVMKGAQYGAAAGAVLGGAKGAYDSYAVGEGGGGPAPSEAAGGSDAAATGTKVETAPPPSDAAQGARTGLLRANMPGSTAAPAATPTTAATATNAGGSGIFDKGGWLERNQGLVGNTLTGLGKGLMAADGDAQVKAMKERAEIIRSNYGGGGRAGLLTASSAGKAAGQQPGMAPQQRFSAAGVQSQYVYDPATGRYVLVPAQA